MGSHEQSISSFRQEIDYSPHLIKGIIEAETFKHYFNEVHGERVKKMPKGYSTEHPDIELLKYKQLFFVHKYSDDIVTDKNFAEEVINGCRILKPYLDYINNLFYGEEN